MQERPGIPLRERYRVLRSLVTNPLLSQLHRYVLLCADSGVLASGDDQVLGTPAAYGDFFMDGLLSDLLPRIEKASGLKLFPTYSYFRVYKNGDVLQAHTDRPACEISVTLSLGSEPDRAWPIWIKGADGPAAVSLKPGDALLYRGMESSHWREPFEGHHSAQVFLHYVDRDGPNAEWRFDKRVSLTAFPVRSRNPQ